MLTRPLTVLVSAALAVPVLGAAVLVSASPTAAASLASGADLGPAAHCSRVDRIAVPGAEVQKVACLDDLTTAATVASGHTEPEDGIGLHVPESTNEFGRHIAGTKNPSGVPGVQVDGYFPDTSTFNTYNGWNHDSQFVIRVPDHWNGGLVVTAAPGVRRQYAHDFIVSDFVLAKGYAFASTDKGNNGLDFYKDGTEPGDAIAEWNQRVTQLTLATKAVAKQRYGQEPARTYMVGVSNGGYLTRWQLENNPELYDGGVDWEGTLVTPKNNLLTFQPAALRSYPAYRATGDRAAHAAMIRAGFAPGSEFLWDYFYAYYWDIGQRTYREELDPTYDGHLQAGNPFCESGTGGCDTDYNLATRPASVQRAIKRISLTGRIGKPLLSLHGTLDALLPISIDSDLYDKMIDDAGAGDLHRYYRIEDGSHLDNHYSEFPTLLRPMLPCVRTAFTALEAWTSSAHKAPPPDATIANPHTGDLMINSCSLQ